MAHLSMCVSLAICFVLLLLAMRPMRQLQGLITFGQHMRPSGRGLITLCCCFGLDFDGVVAVLLTV